LNYENDVRDPSSEGKSRIYDMNGNTEADIKQFVKGQPKFVKEFIKATRQIYKLISQNPHITAAQMSENMGLSARQVQKYLKRLQESKKIVRVGGRKIGEWKIVDEDYEGFFGRI
jgi:ATP-dependent DNA helicase RecG